jgi:prophage antirepressor-like protein
MQEENPNQIMRVFENHPIFILKEVDENNKKQFYFKAADVGKILDIKNIHSSIQYFNEKEKGLHKIETPGGEQSVAVLTSRGIYRLLYGSRKPLAEKFREWAGDVLDDIIFNESKELKKRLEEHEKQLEEKDKQLKAEKAKAINLVTKIQNDKVYKIEGWIYIATSKQYSLNNHYRLGQTIDLNRRIAGYKPGRTIGDELYYVFVYKSEDIENLEKMIRGFLKPYRDDVHIDMYTLHWSHMKSLVETICDNYHNVIIPAVNKLIRDNTTCEDAPVSPEKIDIKTLTQTNEDIVLANGKTACPQYYETILDLYKDYDIVIHTAKEAIHTVFDIIDISCPHSRRQIQVRTLLNQLGCVDCKKDKAIKDRYEQLMKPPEPEPTPESDAESASESSTKTNKESPTTKNDYQEIDLIDENSPEFAALGKMDKGRKTRQNAVIKKLAEENIKLTSEYKNFDGKISIMCSYKHPTTTSWNALIKLKSEYCRTCRDLNRDIQKSAIKKQVTEQELIEAAEALGWKHIRKTGKGGYIEWTCPNDHTVTKVYRELLRGFCAECKSSEAGSSE